MQEDSDALDAVVEATHHLFVGVLLVLVKLRVQHVGGTSNVRVRVGPTIRMLVECILLEVGVGGLKVLAKLVPAGVELACGRVRVRVKVRARVGVIRVVTAT